MRWIPSAHIKNKNAFQLDAYRPLQWSSDGDCLPGKGVCLGGVYLGGCLPRGVSAWRDVCPGGVCLGEVSAWGCLPGGLPRGCLPVFPGRVYTSSSVDKIVDTRLWKHYLSTTSFADGNKFEVRFVCAVPVFPGFTCVTSWVQPLPTTWWAWCDDPFSTYFFSTHYIYELLRSSRPIECRFYLEEIQDTRGNNTAVHGGRKI